MRGFTITQLIKTNPMADTDGVPGQYFKIRVEKLAINTTPDDEIEFWMSNEVLEQFMEIFSGGKK